MSLLGEAIERLAAVRRERGDREARGTEDRKRVHPFSASEWDTKDRAHRGANRLSVKRIAGGGVEQHAVGAKRRRIAEDAAHVVGVGDRLEQEDEPGAFDEFTATTRPRPLDERHTTAVDVEPGDVAKRLHGADVDGHARIEPSESARELLLSRLGQEHRANAVPAIFDHSLDDEAPLDDEEPPGACEFGVRHAGILGNSGVIRHDCHVELRYHYRLNADPEGSACSKPMRRLLLAAFAAAIVGASSPAAAHPAPFSFIDVRVQPAAIQVSVVAHIFDVAHDLGIESVERLLDPVVLRDQDAAIRKLVADRVALAANGRVLVIDSWSSPEPLAERQSLRLQGRAALASPAGTVTVTTVMFPYDPQHQTFINVYEGEALTSQAILDASRRRFEYFAGTTQGTFAVVQRFVPSGVHHILIGPDHLLFLIGLLLLGGSIRQLIAVVTAFTIAHSITLSLAALNIVTPPARVVEPAIALSIVYVGADNLMVHGGRDVRAWIAFAFGLIHGFGFANVLREMDLPSRALGWSLFSFNIGVEIGQVFVVVAVASALAALRARSEVAGQRLAFAGSLVVIAAGAYWFIQRVFFPGGMA